MSDTVTTPPKMLTGVQAASFNNLELNAGVFLLGFDASNIADATALRTAVQTALATPANYFGATKGGGTFVATPETRNIELDGMRWPIKGSTVIDSWDIRLTATLAEVGHTNFNKSIMASVAATSGKITTIQIKNTLESSDYLPSVTWVGDLLDGRVCLIQLDNALNVDGLTLTFADKGEGSFPVSFRCHADSLTGDYAPAVIKIFGLPTT